MSVPSRRQTSSRGKRRRSHEALAHGNLAACASCQKPLLPHRACASCGTYRGRRVITQKTRSRKQGAK